MYQDYFGLTEAPFSISPDPRYLFLSDKHREALAHLIYGVGDQGGFVLLTGEVGTGKTTICRCLLQQVPNNADIAFIINPKQSSDQLLQSIFSDLSIDYDSAMSGKELIDRLNQYLLEAHARGRNTILIIDEAQNLSIDVLEQLRLLTNLETNEKKLLQLVLLGQPELNRILEQESMRQLAQRITARYHLTPLSKPEVIDYIEHRLSVAGGKAEIFNRSAVNRIYQLSKGVPRLINIICDRSMLGVYANNLRHVDGAVVNNASQEVLPSKNNIRWQALGIGSAVALLAGLVFFLLPDSSTEKSAAPAAVAESPKSVPASAVDIGKKPISTVVELSDNKPSVKALSQLSLTNQSLAVEQLYRLWFQSALQPTDCELSEPVASGIYCTGGLTDIDKILAFNTPAAIEVSLQDNSRGWLLLEKNVNGAIFLRASQQQVELSRQRLAALEMHNSVLLSRIPAGLELPVSFGDRGTAVAWLGDFLFGESADTDDRVYQQQLRTAVKQEATVKTSGKPWSHYQKAGEDYNSAVFNHSFSRRLSLLQQQLGFDQKAEVGIDLLTAFSQQKYDSDPELAIDEITEKIVLNP